MLFTEHVRAKHMASVGACSVSESRVPAGLGKATLRMSELEEFQT